ncbi:hypothetical protein [Clostridium sp.]|uniref:hypothetical protein n=1 Tax=Clostridium sp. TaxID=1506 RepID=UPI003996A28A
MEKIISKDIFMNFSLDNYYFTEKSIVVATVNYLKSTNNNCSFIGFDSLNNPILYVNGFNYKLKYQKNPLGLISFQSIDLEKVSILKDLIKNSKDAIIIHERLSGIYD